MIALAVLGTLQSIEKITINADLPIEVFQYRGKGYDRKRLIVVMHGTDRNADEYCEHSKGLADRFGALLIAPKFDKERFPTWRYHRGGILDGEGKPRPRHDWTYTMLKKIVEQVRLREGGNLKYWLVGHSAGGQFLNRMCAFDQDGAERVIVSNPGSVVFPRTDWDFSFGMGGLPISLRDSDALRRYLAQPMTFLLGTADNKPDEYFDTSKDAMRQGGGRLQRSTNCFEYGRSLAQKLGVPFGWKLLKVEGVGHDHEKMFSAKNIEEAFR